MRLDSLLIENFRRFRRVELEFPDGVVGLVGRNGAGKSTLVEAIGWALYGNEAARTSKDQIRRRGAGPSDDCRVVLRFTFGGHAYEVARELLGKSQTHVARVSVDGQIAVAPGAQSQREATGFVERLFHMDRRAFFVSLIARQRELAALSDADPADRKRIVAALLRIDSIERAVALAREAKRATRAKVDALVAVSTPPGALDAREKTLAEAAAASARALAEAVARLEAAAGRADGARARADAWAAKAVEFRGVAPLVADRRARVVAVEGEVEAVRGEVATLDGLAAKRAALALAAADEAPARRALEESLAAELAAKEDARRRVELASARAETEKRAAEVAALADVPARLAAVAKPLAKVREAIPAKRNELAKVRERAAAIAADVKQARASRERVASHVASVRSLGADAPCPTCTRPLAEHFDRIAGGLAEELRRADAALAEQNAAADATAHAGATLARDLAALEERERELAAKERTLADAEARRAEVGARAQAEADRVTRLEAALQGGPRAFPSRAEIAKARERVALAGVAARELAAVDAWLDRRGEIEARFASLTDTLAVHRDALASLESRLAVVGFDEAAAGAAEREARDAATALGDARVALARAEDAERRVEEERARLARDRFEAARREEEIAALREELRLLERVAGERDDGLLAEFKDRLAGRVRPVISEHASELFRRLTDGRFSDLELDEEYELRVRDDGESFRLERFSGGESDLANLSLRLAIGEVVAARTGGADFHFLVLDEIFGSQDEVRKGNILRALSELSSRFRQILVITHVEDVKESVEHVLRVVERPDGTSEVVAE